jgi:hypothetical protein
VPFCVFTCNLAPFFGSLQYFSSFLRILESFLDFWFLAVIYRVFEHIKYGVRNLILDQEVTCQLLMNVKERMLYYDTRYYLVY